jgi:hypothetical protein
MTMRSLVAVAAVTLAAYGGAVSAPAVASEPAPAPSSATLHAKFAPNKLGAYSTIEIGFHLYRPGGALPPPLTAVDFLLPTGVSLTTSDLGLDECDQETVESKGAEGCLADSVMGYGNATMVAPTQVEGVVEPAGLTVFEAPPIDRHTTLMFEASGSAPVISDAVILGQMLTASAPFEGNLSTNFPLTPGLPGENDVSVVSMFAAIGPKGVTYYHDVHGKSVPYTPKGLVIPSHCPAGGFPFGAKFQFADGSSESVSTTSPCPHSGGGHS